VSLVADEMVVAVMPSTTKLADRSNKDVLNFRAKLRYFPERYMGLLPSGCASRPEVGRYALVAGDNWNN
jgi:hypothetical protein